MCPGGTVVAATSEPGRVVTNGMSQYSRAERNANAGIVVGIAPGTTASGRTTAPVSSIRWTAWRSSASGSRAPSSLVAEATARRRSSVGDFLARQASSALAASNPRTSPA